MKLAVISAVTCSTASGNYWVSKPTSSWSDIPSSLHSLHTSTPKLRLWAGGLQPVLQTDKRWYKVEKLLRNAPSSVCVCRWRFTLSAGEETMVLKVLRTRCCSFAEFWPCGWFIAYFRVPNTHKDSHTHTRKKLQISLSHYHLLTLFHSWAGFKLRTKVPNSFRSKLRLCCSSIRDWTLGSII